jgi:hypothetical protein
MSSQGGEGGGSKLPILLSKKTTKMGGRGQKSPILRQHSLWTEICQLFSLVKNFISNKMNQIKRVAKSLLS